MVRKEIRIVVGEKGDQVSPVWKIWNTKNDVYLSGKFAGGAFKISMHASGAWIVAATSESGIELTPGNRRMKTWHRPKQFKQGWTWGPHIVVPRIESRDDLKIDENQTKLIEWIPKPNNDEKVVIAIIFADSSFLPKDISQISAKGDAYLEEFLELANKEKVFIRIRYEKLSRTDHKNISYLNAEADKWIEANKDGIRGFLTSFMQGGEVPFAYTVKFGHNPKTS